MDNNQIAAVLSEYNFIVVVDASGSMGEADMAGGRTRWAHMQETALAFTRDMDAMDSDGIDVVAFGGSTISTFNNVTSAKVAEIFTSRRPMGGTPLSEALQAAFDIANKSDKKAFIIVYTDGVPDDKDAAANTIIAQANKQESDDELTVLFVQVGTDAGATAYLAQLDDGLKAAKFDIVDTKTMAEAEAFPSTVELVIFAIND